MCNVCLLQRPQQPSRLAQGRAPLPEVGNVASVLVRVWEGVTPGFPCPGQRALTGTRGQCGVLGTVSAGAHV